VTDNHDQASAAEAAVRNYLTLLPIGQLTSQLLVAMIRDQVPAATPDILTADFIRQLAQEEAQRRQLAQEEAQRRQLLDAPLLNIDVPQDDNRSEDISSLDVGNDGNPVVAPVSADNDSDLGSSNPMQAVQHTLANGGGVAGDAGAAPPIEGFDSMSIVSSGGNALLPEDLRALANGDWELSAAGGSVASGNFESVGVGMEPEPLRGNTNAPAVTPSHSISTPQHQQDMQPPLAGNIAGATARGGGAQSDLNSDDGSRSAKQEGKELETVVRSGRQRDGDEQDEDKKEPFKKKRST
jgi:hypothetical protein